MNSKAFEGFGSVIFRVLDKIGEKALQVGVPQSPFILRPSLTKALLFRQVFAQNKISTFAELAKDPRRIEKLLNRHPPFGTQIVEQVKALPKFTLEVTEHDTRTSGGDHPVEIDIEITISATIGKAQKKKSQSNYTMSCLVVTSDGLLVDFRRSAVKNCSSVLPPHVSWTLTFSLLFGRSQGTPELRSDRFSDQALAGRARPHIL